jgi:hypothetical protein
MENLNHFKKHLSQSYNEEILRRQRRKYLENELEKKLENQRIKEFNSFIRKKDEEELNHKKELMRIQYHNYLNGIKLQREKDRKLYQEYQKPNPIPCLDMSNNEQNLFIIKNKILKNINKIEDHYKIYQNYQKKNNSINLYNQNILKLKGNNNYNNMKRVYGIKKTISDITNDEIFDKNQKNQEYKDYISMNKNYDEYNEKLMEQKNILKENNINQNMMLEEQKNKESEKYYKQLDYDEKLFEKEKKMCYKKLLDEQIDNEIMRLKNNQYKEIYPYKYIPFNNQNNIPSYILLNRKKSIDINPYNLRKYDIGNTNLKYNTILNPKIQFKFNKYIFPKIKKNASADNIFY